MAAMAAPHFLYAFVWLWPSVWLSIFGKENALSTFTLCGFLGKVMQAQVVLIWFWSSRSSGLCLLQPIGILQWLAALMLIASGQALNLACFKALGTDGVYYGAKLGKTIPWVTCWPFNHGLSHPQYMGSALTVWGIAILLHSQMTVGSPAQNGVVMAACGWTALYALSAATEQYL